MKRSPGCDASSGFVEPWSGPFEGGRGSDFSIVGLVETVLASGLNWFVCDLNYTSDAKSGSALSSLSARRLPFAGGALCSLQTTRDLKSSCSGLFSRLFLRKYMQIKPQLGTSALLEPSSSRRPFLCSFQSTSATLS